MNTINWNQLRDFIGSTRSRLTLSYLSIIMVMSIGFSTVFYVTTANELARQIPPRAVFDPRSTYDDSFVPTVNEYLRHRVEESKHTLLFQLIGINGLTLVFGAAISYFLARKTLAPIERAVKAQSQFISDASHELRTPLTSLQVSNEVALRRKEMSAEDGRMMIEHNLEEVIKLRNLTDGLLRLASDESSGFAAEPVSTQSVVADAMNNVLQPAQDKQIGIDDQTKNVFVTGDKQGLTQIVVILLDNAIKYSDKDSTVTVTSEKRGKYGILSVSDQGVGIRASDLEHVFKRFYRADPSRSKEKRDGYGLGLSIAKKLIDEMEGEITVTSKLGKGTTFTIRLPLSNAPQGNTKAQQQ